MNRNTESHFALTPSISIGRSKFERQFDHKTTLNCGDLVPIYCSDVLPGDSIKMRTSEVIRMMTPIAPVLDNCYADLFFFFVPNRLVWSNFKRFMGENDTAPWAQTNTYEVPQIVAPSAGWKKGSLADYFGYPTEVGSYKASALPFRCYAKIWNDWFMDENLKNPCYISLGDADITGTDKTTLGASYDYTLDTEKGAAPCKVAKFHDYFTSGLPNAQKGAPVNIPLGKTAPVRGTEVATDELPAGYTNATSLVDEQIALYKTSSYEMGARSAEDVTATSLDANKIIGLVTDLSNAVGATVNQLRQAFAIQKYLEKDALYGWACA